MTKIYQVSAADLERIVEQVVSEAFLKVLGGSNVDVFDGLPDLLKTSQVCEVLNTSQGTVMRWIKEGLLNPVYARPGAHPMYNKSEVQEFYRKMRSTK